MSPGLPTSEEHVKGKGMNEQQWEDADDPIEMLLVPPPGLPATDRKIRLFCCACCRRIWHLLADESRKAVEVGEQFTDGLTDSECLEDALREADRPMLAMRRDLRKARGEPPLPKALSAAILARLPCWPTSTYARVVGVCVDPIYRMADPCSMSGLCDLMHDIFGNPFRPVTLAPAVLTWNDATVVRLAQAAYQERHMPAGTLDNGRLAVLSDALEEAGCMDQDILGHLRGPGPHVRGCWPVDLLLGKG
jgi:hypothetical protein